MPQLGAHFIQTNPTTGLVVSKLTFSYLLIGHFNTYTVLLGSDNIFIHRACLVRVYVYTVHVGFITALPSEECSRVSDDFLPVLFAGL